MKRTIYFFLISFLSFGLLTSCAKQGRFIMNPDVRIEEQGSDQRNVRQPEVSSEKFGSYESSSEVFQGHYEIFVDEVRIPDDKIVCMGNDITIWLSETPPTEPKILVDGVEYVEPVEEPFVVLLNGLQVSYTDNNDGTLSFVVDD
jgi:hypothetical protein